MDDKREIKALINKDTGGVVIERYELKCNRENTFEFLIKTEKH